MLRLIKNWLTTDDESARRPNVPPVRTRPAQPPVPAPLPTETAPDVLEIADDLAVVEETADRGPGKNVLVAGPLYRVETGTYEALELVDEGEPADKDQPEQGIDPYNTGSFDRPGSWDKVFRK